MRNIPSVIDLLLPSLTLKEWLTLKATSKEIYDYISAYLANSIRHFPKRVHTIFNESVVKEFSWNHDDYASLFNILAYLKIKNIFTKPYFIANAAVVLNDQKSWFLTSESHRHPALAYLIMNSPLRNRLEDRELGYMSQFKIEMRNFLFLGRFPYDEKFFTPFFTMNFMSAFFYLMYSQLRLVTPTSPFYPITAGYALCNLKMILSSQISQLYPLIYKEKIFNTIFIMTLMSGFFYSMYDQSRSANPISDALLDSFYVAGTSAALSFLLAHLQGFIRKFITAFFDSTKINTVRSVADDFAADKKNQDPKKFLVGHFNFFPKTRDQKSADLKYSHKNEVPRYFGVNQSNHKR